MTKNSGLITVFLIYPTINYRSACFLTLPATLKPYPGQGFPREALPMPHLYR